MEHEWKRKEEGEQRRGGGGGGGTEAEEEEERERVKRKRDSCKEVLVHQEQAHLCSGRGNISRKTPTNNKKINNNINNNNNNNASFSASISKLFSSDHVDVLYSDRTLHCFLLRWVQVLPSSCSLYMTVSTNNPCVIYFDIGESEQTNSLSWLRCCLLIKPQPRNMHGWNVKCST